VYISVYWSEFLLCRSPPKSASCPICDLFHIFSLPAMQVIIRAESAKGFVCNFNDAVIEMGHHPTWQMEECLHSCVGCRALLELHVQICIIILGFPFLDWGKPWASTFMRGSDHLSMFCGVFCLFSVLFLVLSDFFFKQFLVASFK